MVKILVFVSIIIIIIIIILLLLFLPFFFSDLDETLPAGTPKWAKNFDPRVLTLTYFSRSHGLSKWLFWKGYFGKYYIFSSNFIKVICGTSSNPKIYRKIDQNFKGLGAPFKKAVKWVHSIAAKTGEPI